MDIVLGILLIVMIVILYFLTRSKEPTERQMENRYRSYDVFHKSDKEK